MIQSMTGFGKSKVDFSHKKITFQIKSLNSKRLDLYSRVPSEYKEKELELHKMINDALGRGKVDFSMNVENVGAATHTKINASVVKNYMDQLREIATSDQVEEVAYLKMAISLPEALTSEEEEIDEKEFEALKVGMQEALDRLNQYRTDEGKALEADFVLRIQNLTDLLNEVESIDSNRIAETKERIRTAIDDLKVEVDENRFEQELVYYIEKYDITEEKTRLKNHLNYFTETLNLPESNGRKLGFIAQEMGREINTIGSKSNHAPMQKIVVQMKDELEKIKEQLLNVL